MSRGALVVVVLVSALPLVWVASGLVAHRAGQKKVSSFGRYEGYSEAPYDGYVRRSDYLALADGTKLAYDLLLPTRDGTPAEGPLPVLFQLTPYLRVVRALDAGEVTCAKLFGLKEHARAFLRLRAALRSEGHLLDQVFRTPWLRRMLRHGYAVAAVERPGTGASFGRVHPSFERAAGEAGEILDWIAGQPWCDGNIGMYGHSNAAMLQYAAASSGNPHLKAIFPCSGGFDLYDAVSYPGGIYNTAFNSLFASSTQMLERLIAPVGSDPEGALLARALEERSDLTLGEASGKVLRSAPFRDSARAGGERLWDEVGLYRFLVRINGSKVPVYNSNGWYDLFARDVFLWHANLTGPRRLHVRPLFHKDMDEARFDLDYGAEAHRWFDRWLKGIDNGIADEPPVWYFVMGAPKGDAWRSARSWPPPGQRTARFYFSGGKTGSVASANDGFLREEPPSEAEAGDSYAVERSTTTGSQSRWRAVLEPGRYPDMRPNDEKGLTYTTPPLQDALEVTGHPVVHLWISTDAPDADFFVYLEEVDASGESTYVTEGQLRASHRRPAAPPYENLGLPYRRGYGSDAMPIPAGEPVELVLDLLPTSRLFRRGSRIRLAVTGADAGNFEPLAQPAPQIRLLRNPTHASFVDLPVMPGG